MNEEIITSIGECKRGDGYIIATNLQSIICRIEIGIICCEISGYFFLNDKPSDFIGSKILDINLKCDMHSEKKLNDNLEWAGIIERDVQKMVVNIVTDKGVLNFVLYCSHPHHVDHGHYARIISNQLNHDEYL